MTTFDVYTPASAPAQSKEILGQWQERLGFPPNALGVMSESPALLRGYDALWHVFEGGSFSLIERAVINMTISGLSGSSYDVAAYTNFGAMRGVPMDVLTALREERPLADARLEALRGYVAKVVKSMGRVDGRDVDAFIKAGFSKAQSLEVILGLSINAILNTVNHLAAPVLDKAFEPHRIDYSRRPAAGKSSNAA